VSGHPELRRVGEVVDGSPTPEAVVERLGLRSPVSISMNSVKARFATTPFRLTARRDRTDSCRKRRRRSADLAGGRPPRFWQSSASSRCSRPKRAFHKTNGCFRHPRCDPPRCGRGHGEPPQAPPGHAPADRLRAVATTAGRSWVEAIPDGPTVYRATATEGEVVTFEADRRLNSRSGTRLAWPSK
jgi:hypothetical protein